MPRNTPPLWPRILAVMEEKPWAWFSVTDLAVALDENVDRIWASMSSMRAMSGVARLERKKRRGFCLATPNHWIRAHEGRWWRSGHFIIEKGGKDELARWRKKHGNP